MVSRTHFSDNVRVTGVRMLRVSKIHLSFIYRCRDFPFSNKEQELPVIMRLLQDGHFDTPFNFWPQSDVRLDVKEFPIILTEIDSGTKLDENRLMLQASYLAKVACLAQKEIAVMAIYFSRSGTARIYLVASDSNYKVKLIPSQSCLTN
jgi:hypothetical protein